MTQFLPTFPAFLARRFSRTSNDDEIANNSPPASYSNKPTIVHDHGVASIASPSMEEEETAMSSEDHIDAPPQETMPPNPLSIAETISVGTGRQDWEHTEPADLGLPDGQVASEILWEQGRRENALYAEGDASSSSSQEVAHGLRSAASSTSSSIRSAQDAPVRTPLPADDGMSAMRARIVEIQNGPVSSDEKARQMLVLMTERYNSSQASLRSLRPFKVRSRSSSARPELPSSADSNQSIEAINVTSSSPPTSPSSDSGEIDRFHLTSDDCQPTYYKRTRRPSDGHGSSGKGLESSAGSSDLDDDLTAYGCRHYKRNIKLQCSTCSRWYTCRFCHDSVEDHKLVRRATKYMLCMFCNCAQKASGVCIECDQRAAWYYCDVCKLWDDNPDRSIYHCEDCGICRVGKGIGKDFYHCKVGSQLKYVDIILTFNQTCSACLEIGIADSHRCIERSTDCDCPICGEYMFTSPDKVVFMKCGHSIHQKCYGEHIQRSYRCPICSRSVLNMEANFGHLKRLINMQPMPSHLQDTKALVYCNDCSAKTTVKYHWLGCACDM